VALFQ